MFRFATLITILTVFAVSPVNARGMFLDLAGQAAGDPSWIVDCPDCNGEVAINFQSTYPGERPLWLVQTLDFTNFEFEAEFGDGGTFAALFRPDPVGAPGQTNVDIDFPFPLPAGSKMVVMDIDATNETLRFESNLGALGMPTMMESNHLENSVFASWNGETNTLSANPAAPNNDKEAYYWDVSGLQNMDVTYTTAAGHANIGFMINQVPEPAGIVALLSGVFGFALVRRKHRLGRA